MSMSTAIQQHHEMMRESFRMARAIMSEGRQGWEKSPQDEQFVAIVAVQLYNSFYNVAGFFTGVPASQQPAVVEGVRQVLLEVQKLNNKIEGEQEQGERIPPETEDR